MKLFSFDARRFQLATTCAPRMSFGLGAFQIFAAAVFAVLLFGGAVASAQVEAGQIAGIVTDQSGAIVPGATIMIKNVGTNAVRTAVSSAEGLYLVPGLEPAEYQVTVSSASFKPFVAKVEVTVGGHLTVDAKLSVSSAVTVVQVVGEGGATVNTQTQEISQVVDTQQMIQLPSLTRNPYDFVSISGNVSSGDSTTTSSSGLGVSGGQNLTNRGVGFALNGQRETSTEILLDGVENIAVFSEGVGEDIPVDATQEYSVITNNFPAEYGRASGGVVNVTTKAGTNAIHGSAWEFNRLSDYTANTYGNDALGTPKGAYTRNQFGYAAGGPIIKNKLFIFESTEWTRVRSSAAETEEVFDPAFIALMPANIQAYYKTYGGGVLKSSGVAATVGDEQNNQNQGKSFGMVNGTTPVPSTTPMFDSVNFTAPFDAGGGIPQNTYALVGRLDYNPTEKTQMFFRGARESANEFLGSDFYSAYPQYDVGTAVTNQSYLYSLAHTFTDTLFLSAKASYTRYNTANSFNAALTSTPSLMFVDPTDHVTNQLIQMPGLENTSNPGEGGLPYGGPQNTIQFEPDLSWTKGKHSMRFGGIFTYIQLNAAYGAYAQAVEQLGKGWVASLSDMMNIDGNPNGAQLYEFETRVDPQGKLPCTADVYDSVPTPAPASCEVQPPLNAAAYARSYRYKDWAFYGEDSYKVTPQLTLNYGLRYEHYGVQHNNKPDLDSNFYFGPGSGIEEQTRTGQVFIADKSPIGQFWKPTWGTFAPRIGFAYDILGNGRESIRGGYGISYERNFGNVTFNASFNPPASAVVETPPCVAQTPGAAAPACTNFVTTNNLGPLGVAGGAIPLPPSSLRMPDPLIKTAQTQFWSLDLQHQIVPGTVLDIGYSGARGVHLYDIENIDQYGAAQYYLGDPLIVGDTGCGFQNLDTKAPECLTRPNMQYSSINMRGSLGQSSYNGLNVGFQTQNLRGSGLDLVANYTWSHSLDNLSSTFGDSLQGGSGYVGSLGYTDLAHPMLDWGPSDYDIRNRFTTGPIWNLPWFKQGTTLQREALSGWALSGIFTVRSGVPFSVFDESTVEIGYTIPRLIPATAPKYKVGSPVALGPNNFTALNIPVPSFSHSLNAALGMSDLGPFPATMTTRNAFRGPGAWNADTALEKDFPITERLGVKFRAEGFDVFNHHNFYVNTTGLYYTGGADSDPLTVPEEKGGLGTLATGGNHDERRFGQFALSLTF
jgi:hypothetical protein